MSNIEITEGNWAVMDDDRIEGGCCQDVRETGRIDVDRHNSINVCRDLWREDSIVIDVGAHIGCWTIPMGEAVGSNGLVIAIEADPEVFKCLLYNIGRSPHINARAFEGAAWDHSGTLTFLRNLDNRGASAVSMLPADPGNPVHRPMEVPSIKLDDLSLTQPVSFIKLDVEGAELRCLKGADRLIYEYRPVLFFETLPHAQLAFGNTLDELYDWVKTRGYEIFNRTGHDALCLPR